MNIIFNIISTNERFFEIQISEHYCFWATLHGVEIFFRVIWMIIYVIMLLEKHNNNLYRFKGCEAPSFELVRFMISFRQHANEETFRCFVFPVVWLHQLSIAHDCAGEGRNGFSLWNSRYFEVVMHDSRSTRRFHRGCNPAPISGVNCQVRASCIFVRSFSSPSHWPFTSCFLPCRYSLPTSKEDLPTSSPRLGRIIQSTFSSAWWSNFV